MINYVHDDSLVAAKSEVGPSTLLDRIDASAIKASPFPYVVIEDALAVDEYRELEAALPPIEVLPKKFRECNNRRVDLISSSGRAELPIEQITERWSRFLQDHASERFVDQVVSLFGGHIAASSSRFYQEILGPSWKRALYDPKKRGGGKKFRWMQPWLSLSKTNWLNDFANPQSLQVTGRATLALNTPVIQQTSVRGPHVDSRHKCYVGLFYLRHPDDQSTGGDLELFRWKSGKPRTRWASKISDNELELIETVPYRPNTYVLFLNTDDAIHGVTIRSKSEVPRYLCVTSGWFSSAPERIVGPSFTGQGNGVYEK